MTGVDEAKCDMACKGDESQKCGGAGVLSLYGVDTAVTKRASWMKRGVEEVKGHMKRHGHGDMSRQHARRFGGWA